MKEILPGVYYWKAFRKGIQAYVHLPLCPGIAPPVRSHR